ncbi:MAG: NADH-quinone oxidoreductase subunit M [Streptosporangiaceae bacterium]|nr:NADH-quinone oxidoreductase subunit M [Streptosporangiaceae bacterium]MBV9855579.1 NADH-quinone oxidoreductase subunit M [Streptosporangiaceae bacterium]
MNGFPWLTVAGAIPLAGALLLALVPATPADGAEADRRAREQLVKALALVFSLAALAVVIVIAVRFNVSGPDFQFTESYSWIPQFGVHYALGVDGIALVLIGMTAVLMPVVILASWHDVPAAARHSVKTYFALMLVLETMMIGVFAATDVFLFYVFFEAMLIPMYFMIGSYGTGPRQYAAVKFLLYSLLGGLLMLVAVIALYVQATRSAATGFHGSFLFSELVHVSLSPAVQKWLFLGFFIAFAIKAPLWPFHTWLPDAAASAQPGAAVLMLGVMDKVGTFGMIRYCLELFPAAARYFTPLILTLAVIAILYGAIVAIGQTSLKRLIGYTSISHFGFIALGIFAMTTQGQSGATFYMVNHGFATGALFILAGFLIARRGSDRIADYGGVQKVAPLLAGLFLVSGLAGLSLPGLSTFVSEFLVLVGTFTRYKVAASFATAGIILASIYILWMYQRTMTGPVRDEVAGMPDLRPRELWAVAPLVALIIATGVYPKPVLDIINPAVRATMTQIHVTDPAPPHPAPAYLNNTTAYLKTAHPAAAQKGILP